MKHSREHAGLLTTSPSENIGDHIALMRELLTVGIQEVKVLNLTGYPYQLPGNQLQKETDEQIKVLF
jgi:hypothetical protein|tara:strand:+ start:1369 stop:1569 length:201 start_codon:yes stop_codon:yes gene_type:complete